MLIGRVVAFCALCCLFVGTVRAQAPTLAQYKIYQTTGEAGESTSAVQFNTVTKAGNTIWVAVTLSDYAGAHSLKITDTQGNAYVLLNQENDGAPGSQTLAHFYASNIAGDGSTPDVVTLSTGYENYRGLLVAEIAGAGSPSLVGSAANIQDGLAAGSSNVTSGGITLASAQTPALMVAVSMNTSGGSSDTGGSGFGGPASGAGFTQVAQMWNFGVNLATFETAPLPVLNVGDARTGGTPSTETLAALFNAPDTDSYVTVAAVFLSAASGTPSVSLAASPASIVSGTNSALTWSATNATSCSASGAWSGSEPVTGTAAVAPTSTSTYTLSCANSAGSSAPQSATVVVVPPAPTVTIIAGPVSIVAGSTSTLTWSSTAATSCSASGGWAGAEPTSGSLAVSPTATTSYALTCSNASGTVTASTTVVVNPAPAPTAVPSATLTAVSGTLTWTSTGASACAASGSWTGTRATSGKLKVTPATTSTYTLTCSNAAGYSPPVSATVTVAPPAPTVIFSANAASILSGGTSVLTWSSSNATTCTASGTWTGTQALSGSVTVTPAATSTYTLTCGNAGLVSAMRTATVTVITAAVPRLVQYATYQTAQGNGENGSTVQFNTPTRAGDTLWVAATVSDYAGAHKISVTDSQGNVFTKLDQKNDGAPGSQSVAHFYASNIVGDSSIPDTVSVNWTYDNYKGIVITEIAGTVNAPLVGHSARIQDGLSAGSNNVTTGPVAVASGQSPALVVALAMNTSGGSSDLGGSGFGGPAAGSGFTQVGQFWNWGLNLATLATASLPGAGGATAYFNAPDTDSYITVSAVFY